MIIIEKNIEWARRWVTELRALKIIKIEDYWIQHESLENKGDSLLIFKNRKLGQKRSYW